MRSIQTVWRKNLPLAAAYAATGILIAFLANFKAVCFQRVVDAMTDGALCLSAIAVYAAVLVADVLVNYADEYPAKKLENGLFLDFKLLALVKISTIAYGEYQKLGAGKLVQRIENGAQAGRNMLFGFWMCVVRQLLPTVLFSVGFIWRISRAVTLALLLGYGVVFLATHLLLKGLYRLKERVLDGEERLGHTMVRGFMEMVLFRVARRFPREIARAKQAKREIVFAKVSMNLIHEAFFALFALLVAALDVGILVYAWRTRSLTVGQAVALLTLTQNAYTPIAIFNVLYVQYKLDRSAYARFEAFLGMEDDAQLHSGKRLCGEIGDIRVRGLSFGYGEKRLFDGLSLAIRAGEKVAFVGESGSGKSTLAKLLTGLLKYDAGHITLGGEELRGICLEDYYGKMAYLSQDAPVFDGTIRENLAFDRALPDGELLEALRAMQLEKLVSAGQAGLDAPIGERGAALSGGEKQRLALARLWLTAPELIVLDEATSAMDNLTEERVMRSLMRRFDGCTVIAIAHRLRAVSGFDRIVVFREGRIAGQGRFDELLANNAYFARLVKAEERAATA